MPNNITINPKSLVTDGAPVSTANPLPCVETAAGPVGPNITLNPSSWVVNGNIVSPTNPLPIVLV